MIDLNVDVAQVEKALQNTSKSVKQISRGVLSIVGKGVKKEESKILSRVHGNGLIAHKYPYRVSKCIRYKIKSDASKVSIYPAKIDNTRGNDLTVPVISTLNYGKTIVPRSAAKPYLIFQTKQGEWRKVKSVRINGLHFVDAGLRYAGSTQYMADVEKYIQKELDKFWK